MKEKFLHFLWRYRRFDVLNICTTENQRVDILDTGEYNTHSGPDFLHARLKIGDMLWIGNVEMHLRASEWIAHGHHEDKAYNNVILHVVYEEDAVIQRMDGTRIPCLVIKNYLRENLSGIYEQLQQNTLWIPCRNQLQNVSEICKNSWWQRMLIERMEQKTERIGEDLQRNNRNWEETFYLHLARSFGLSNNELPFEMLARTLPLSIISRHRDRPLQLEALYFGQSGLLDDVILLDEYPKQLKKEYLHLKRKYGLQPLQKSTWKFLRMRPLGFPTLRIAQFAAFMGETTNLFATFMEATEVEEIEGLLQREINTYWDSHYVFDKSSSVQKKQLGKDSVRRIIINTVCPFIFAFGRDKNNPMYQETAFDLLEQLEPEANAVIDKWRVLGINVKSAAESQALLYQKKYYCDLKRCLECGIGNFLLR